MKMVPARPASFHTQKRPSAPSRRVGDVMLIDRTAKIASKQRGRVRLPRASVEFVRLILKVRAFGRTNRN